MIAMILAAGVGSRLSPLTLFMPKPMVPIANKPVMEHIIDQLARGGITQIVANLNYLPEQIENYFGSGQRWGVNLSYSLEKELLGTAGAVKRVEDIFDDTLVVLMGDSLTDLDLKAMLAFHRERQAQVTIALHTVEDPSRFGVVLTGEQGRILSFQEKPPLAEAASNMVSMGVYILEPSVLKLIPENTPYDFGHQLFPLLLEQGLPFYGFESDCYYSDVGSFGELRAAQFALLNEQVRGAMLPARKTAPGIWQGRNTTIHPSARLVPPLLIGDDSQINANAEIGPNAVIGNHVIIEEGATISGSAILDGTYVGRLVNVQDSVVNRNCLINVPANTSVFVADHFMLGEVSESVVLRGLGRAGEWLAALLLLLLSLPFWLIATLVALFAGRGPLLGSVQRATHDPQMQWESGKIGWRTVSVARFRSDPATPAGRWLRRTGMCDLPGLVAVLKGELALVGPGVISPLQAEALVEDWQRRRFLVPAGVTGLWYVNGSGAADGDELGLLEERLIVDSYYAATRTFKADLTILLQTPGAWLKRLFTRASH